MNDDLNDDLSDALRYITALSTPLKVCRKGDLSLKELVEEIKRLSEH